jgi:hypothetical protein
LSTAAIIGGAGAELLASAFKVTLAEGEKKQQDLRVAK